MKEVTVASWDDMEFAQGRRVPAEHGPSTVLRLNGKTVELDLSAANKALLADLLRPWLEAGHSPDGAHKNPVGSAAHPRGDLAAARAYHRGMREFADTHGFSYNRGTNGTGSSPTYYSRELRDAYARHLQSLEGSAPAR